MTVKDGEGPNRQVWRTSRICVDSTRKSFVQGRRTTPPHKVPIRLVEHFPPYMQKYPQVPHCPHWSPQNPKSWSSNKQTLKKENIIFSQPSHFRTDKCFCCPTKGHISAAWRSMDNTSNKCNFSLNWK